MSGLRSRRKGASGENEFAGIMADLLGIPVKRILGQARDGGCDILLPGFAVEVKRQERIHMSAWRGQAISAATHNGVLPAVAYRQNRKPWNVCIPVHWHTGIYWPDSCWCYTDAEGFASAVREFIVSDSLQRERKGG